MYSALAYLEAHTCLSAANDNAPLQLTTVKKLLSNDGLRPNVNQSYDGLGRLKDTTFNDGATPNITRAYDANSNLTHLNRGSGASAVNWEYVYDSYNRLTDEELTLDSKSFDTSYKYNGLGHIYRKTLPSGRNITYFNDGLGRHNKVSWGTETYADTVNYHPLAKFRPSLMAMVKFLHRPWIQDACHFP